MIGENIPPVREMVQGFSQSNPFSELVLFLCIRVGRPFSALDYRVSVDWGLADDFPRPDFGRVEDDLLWDEFGGRHWGGIGTRGESGMEGEGSR